MMLLLFSCSVMSNSLQPHGLQHARLPCPSPSPGVCLNSCPSSRRCHFNHLILVVPLSSCFQSFPASRPFLMSQLFASGGQSIGASASVLPVNIQDWFLNIGIAWFDFLTVQETLKDLFQNHSLKGPPPPKSDGNMSKTHQSQFVGAPGGKLLPT